LTLGCLRDIISKLTRDEDTDTGTGRKLSDGWWSWWWKKLLTNN